MLPNNVIGLLLYAVGPSFGEYVADPYDVADALPLVVQKSRRQWVSHGASIGLAPSELDAER